MTERERRQAQRSDDRSPRDDIVAGRVRGVASGADGADNVPGTVDVDMLRYPGYAAVATRIRRRSVGGLAPIRTGSVAARIQRKGGKKDKGTAATTNGSKQTDVKQPGAKPTDAKQADPSTTTGRVAPVGSPAQGVGGQPTTTDASWLGGMVSGTASYLSSWIWAPTPTTATPSTTSTTDVSNGAAATGGAKERKDGATSSTKVTDPGGATGTGTPDANGEPKSQTTGKQTKSSQEATGMQAAGNQTTGKQQTGASATKSTATAEPDDASDAKRPAVPTRNNLVDSAVNEALVAGNAILVRAKAAGVDASEIVKSVAGLTTLQSEVPPHNMGPKGWTTRRGKLWNAAHDLKDAVATLDGGPLQAANTQAGWTYRSKVNAPKLAAAIAASKLGHDLKVDVGALDRELAPHVAATKPGATPDNHALVASLSTLATLTAAATTSFVEPAKTQKLAAIHVPKATSAIEAADKKLAADKDHTRDSDYWKHLIAHYDRVTSALQRYDTQMQAPVADWVEVRKAVDSMSLWTRHVLLEVDQADAHLVDRVGRNGVALEVHQASGIKGDKSGTGLTAESAALIETLNLITNNKGKWNGMVAGGKWAEEFGNAGGDLPESATYTEYYVRPPAGTPKKLGGLRRVIVGSDRRRYYTWTHYGDDGKPAFVLLKGYGGV